MLGTRRMWVLGTRRSWVLARWGLCHSAPSHPRGLHWTNLRRAQGPDVALIPSHAAPLLVQSVRVWEGLRDIGLLSPTGYLVADPSVEDVSRPFGFVWGLQGWL